MTGTVVTPVVDYEPPPSRHRPARGPRPGRARRSPPPPAPFPPPMSSLSPLAREATRFADAALRHVLEVIDRRRPLAQLRGLLAAGLLDSVLALYRPDSAGTAVLQRVRAQVVRPSDPAAAEAFATYRRGQRIHAIACRVQRVDGRWQVVALHIG